MFKNFKLYLRNKENNIENNINRLLPFFIILLFIILNVTIIFNLYTKQTEKSDILRLHVVANSNSIKDQITKLKVYENVNNYISNITKDKNLTKEDIIEDIQNNAQDIITISNNVLKENNQTYSSSLNIGKIKYEKKQSMLIDMEKGTYDSIQIVLGNGNGKNIWSLIAPSKENIQSLKNLDTILPGINSLYTSKTSEKDTPKSYDIKIFEIINKIKNFNI